MDFITYNAAAHSNRISELSAAECTRTLQEMIAIFAETGLEYSPLLNPPGWEITESLTNAMIETGIKSVASAGTYARPSQARQLRT